MDGRSGMEEWRREGEERGKEQILWEEEGGRVVGRYYGRRKVEGCRKIFWKGEGGRE